MHFLRGKRLLRNTALLTLIAVGLRLLGLWFQVWLSRRMGAAGIGVFTLVLSVYGFAATLAIGGIRFATTRVVSEVLGQGREGQLPQVMRRSLLYGSLTGLGAAACLFLGADVLAERVLGHPETVFSLRVLAAGLPPLALGAAFGGYFTGREQVGRAGLVALTEELSRVAVSVILLSHPLGASVGEQCTAAALGCAAGELCSCLVAFLLYGAERRKLGPGEEEPALLGRLTGIALPLAGAACARMALNALQNLRVPRGLERAGASREAALAGYGTVQGMVFPILTFPGVLFASLAELVVPELTAEQVQGREERIAEAASRLLGLTTLISLGLLGLFRVFAEDLGRLFYGDPQIGVHIAALAFLMPLMYTDTVTDGLLRGLGAHLTVMRLNIVDSLLCLGLIGVLLPRYALGGYIALLYLSELFNLSLSLGKLLRLTKLRGLGYRLAQGLVALVGAGNAAALFRKIWGERGFLPALCLYALLYLLLLRLLDGAPYKSRDMGHDKRGKGGILDDCR